MKTYLRILLPVTAIFGSVISALTIRAQSFDVPLTNQFIAMYSATTTTTTPKDTWTVINFDAVEADTANAVTTGSNWHFTAPDTAYIQINTCVQFGAITSALSYYDLLAIFKNGTYFKKLVFYYEPGSFPYTINPTLNGSAIIRVQKNDVVDIRLWHHAASAGYTTNVPEDSWITINRVK